MEKDIQHAIWKLLDQLLKMERSALEIATTIGLPESEHRAFFMQSVSMLHSIELQNLIHARNLLARHLNINAMEPGVKDILYEHESENPKAEAVELFTSLAGIAHSIKLYYLERYTSVGKPVLEVFEANLKLVVSSLDEVIEKVWQITSRFINSQRKLNTE